MIAFFDFLIFLMNGGAVNEKLCKEMSFKIHSVIKCIDNYAFMNFDFGSQKKIFSITSMFRKDL